MAWSKTFVFKSSRMVLIMQESIGVSKTHVAYSRIKPKITCFLLLISGSPGRGAKYERHDNHSDYCSLVAHVVFALLWGFSTLIFCVISFCVSVHQALCFLLQFFHCTFETRLWPSSSYISYQYMRVFFNPLTMSISTICLSMANPLLWGSWKFSLH